MPQTSTANTTNTHPLSLMMPLRPDADVVKLFLQLAGAQSELNKALDSVGTVHFARFLLLDTSQPNLQPGPGSKGPFVLSVITEYDGSFDKYLQDFCLQLGDVFDLMLDYVVGGDALKPVSRNVQAFTAYVQQNDLSQHGTNQGLYAAYPLTVQQILADE